jgi:hypothetical protein
MGMSSTTSVERLDLFAELDIYKDDSLEEMKCAANEEDASTLRHHRDAILQDVNTYLEQKWSNHSATSAPMDRFMEDDAAILRRIDQEHDLDCAAASRYDAILAMEPRSDRSTAAPSYEWVWLSGNHSKVLQSTVPLLNATVIQGIRQGAAEIWFQGNTSSRFTYQSQSNYEVHVADVLLRNASLRAQFNEVLLDNIYPLLRHTLLPRYDTPEQLFVYDALVIRYNATAGTRPAGQPWHRDYGLATVNVLLNDPEEFFHSGGTFLEQQLPLATTKKDGMTAAGGIGTRPLHPNGVGYGLAHWASQRHAGAGIARGIREILVVFVTSTAPTIAGSDPWVPSYRNTIRNTQLKQCRTYCEERYPGDPAAIVECRIRHQRLAMLLEPSDGEAVQYLGTALLNDAAVQSPLSAAALLQWAVRCGALASQLTPQDYRVYNNRGIAQNRLRDLRASGPPGEVLDVDPARIHESFARALELLEQSMVVMGRVASLEEAWASTALNYALVLAHREAWVDAVELLEWIPVGNEDDGAFGTNSETDAPSSSSHEQVLQDAYKLWQFCQCQIVPSSSSSWNI